MSSIVNDIAILVQRLFMAKPYLPGGLHCFK